MNKNKIKLGFIGLGFVAQQCHLPTFSVNPNFKIEAISDPYEDLRKQDSRTLWNKNVYKSHKEMLEKSDIEAVVITLLENLLIQY